MSLVHSISGAPGNVNARTNERHARTQAACRACTPCLGPARAAHMTATTHGRCGAHTCALVVACTKPIPSSQTRHGASVAARPGDAILACRQQHLDHHRSVLAWVRCRARQNRCVAPCLVMSAMFYALLRILASGDSLHTQAGLVLRVVAFS